MSTYTVPLGNFTDILTVTGIVDPVNTTTLNCPQNIDAIIEWLVEDGKQVKEGDTLCILKDQTLHTNYDSWSASLENFRAELNKIAADLAMQYALLEAQVKNNEADAEIARLDSAQLAYLPPTQQRLKELELQKVAIEKARLDKKIKALAIINQSEIRKREIQIMSIENRVKTFKEQIDGQIILAPCDGVAVRAISWSTDKKLKVGDNVWNNMPVVILPRFESMKVMLRVPETDYKIISTGDSVSYTFDAMPGSSGWGRILIKAHAGRPVQEDSKVKYFDVEASIDSAVVAPDPGFTASCHIVLKELRGVVVIPQIAIFGEDSIKTVYVEQAHGYELRQIRTGLSSTREAVVTQGLEAGEVIALVRPQASLVKKQTMLPTLSAAPPPALPRLPFFPFSEPERHRADSMSAIQPKETVPSLP